MTLDPVISGLQTSRIPAGKLVLFETADVKRQNMSVDREDNGPADLVKELLAGEGMYSCLHRHGGKGFVHLSPLLGLADDPALDVFEFLHPTLKECVDRQVISKCPYDLEVCVTCRRLVLNKITNFPTLVTQETHGVLKTSTGTADLWLRGEWGRLKAELSSAFGDKDKNKAAIGQLTLDHMRVMQQLHERTPEDAELMKLQMQHNSMTAAMQEQTERLATLLVQNQNTPPSSEVLAMQEQMLAMQRKIEELTGLVGDRVLTKPETAPE